MHDSEPVTECAEGRLGLDEDVELQSIAEQAGRDVEGATAHEVIRWAVETFGARFAIASSMGDGLLAHLAASVSPGIDILFLDTGYHFAETIGTRDAVAASYDVKLRTVLPLLTVQQQDAEYGPDLWNRDPTACCAMRKVEPLSRALEPYVAWGSGVRRDEAVTRRDTRVVEWDSRRGKVKVNPIAAWTQADVDAYVHEHGVLVNPLAYDGYPSIGCAPCTHRVAPGEDPRSGRWSGQAKTECGLHV
jgi:phosphoadenosine phosphosulfate reductase